MSVRALLLLLDGGNGANLVIFIGLIGLLCPIWKFVGNFGLGIIAVAKILLGCKK